jgi:ATP-dependent helicase/nuclease subunit A
MSRKPVIVDAITRERQATASDPNITVWVSANAGSGKTHVLSQRVIRLLLDGVEPSRILCLTYTKTAAAEMENRVFQRLAAWTALDDDALVEAIASMEERKPDAKRLKRARNLFARALETPGGLQIQTIHAFCTAVLKRFPLEANIAGHFELLDDETGDLLRGEAIRQVKAAAQRGGDERLVEAFETALDAGGDSGLDTLLEAALSGPNRSAITGFLQALENGVLDDAVLARIARLPVDATEAGIISALWPLKAMPPDLMREYVAQAPNASGKSIPVFAEALLEALQEADPKVRLGLLGKVFLLFSDGKATGPKSPRNLLKISPDFEQVFYETADEIMATLDVLARLAMLKASRAAHVLLGAVQAAYRKLKRAHGGLDYDDLIEATRSLLQRDAAAAWVQYKLDQGIDHVLVDEAQDTSPRQWDLVNALTGDFFVGETASERLRTLFVVGDEKQSIYSFQGARPEVFAATGKDKQLLVEAAARNFSQVNLPLSFRSTPEVLKAVDHVFESLPSGTGFSSGSYLPHTAMREKEHGKVEVWQRILKSADDSAQQDTDDDWTLAVDHLSAPAVVLAREIATVIDSMVGKERNPATGRLVRAGDILVLVRKRDQFMHALARELKNRQVPVAGADRLVLTSHIAILDLLALARIVLQPDDDLSLAALLRSPVFGLSDEELLPLAAKREGKVSLLSRLESAAKSDAKLDAIVQYLKRWRDEADFVPVYEFFARVLGRDGVRKRLISQLGEEASDIIDEFLSFALTSEKSGLHGLQSFVETLEDAAPEIKREASAGRDEVRIMTVHGAKGLESPYVFLVDPGSEPAPSQHMPSLFGLPVSDRFPDLQAFFWVPQKELRNSVTEAVRETMKAGAEAEYRRLLYVGMTRAEDVLIACGYGGTKEKDGTWLELMRSGLAGKDHTTLDTHPLTGRARQVFLLGETSEFTDDQKSADLAQPAPAPAWLGERLPPVILPPRPLTPSGTGLAIEESIEANAKSPVLDPKDDDPNEALRRGSAVHRLLEVLPGFEVGKRAEAAERYLARALGGTAIDTGRLLDQVMTILNDTSFAPGSRAEVSIGGTITIGGETRSISGKIDRLAVTDGHVLIVDYKTNRPAPKRQVDVPQNHIAQLALYQSVLQPLYPDKKVEAALVYTEGPNVIHLDAASLNAALEALTAS